MPEEKKWIGERTEESYQLWRSKIPWTDEEIVSALERSKADIALLTSEARRIYLMNLTTRSIDQVRRGRLSRNVLVFVLPFLVTKCKICGKKAIYRMGNEGRCSGHRDVRSVGFEWNLKQHDLRSAKISEKREENERRFLNGLKYHRARGHRRRPHR